MSNLNAISEEDENKQHSINSFSSIEEIKEEDQAMPVRTEDQEYLDNNMILEEDGNAQQQ